MHLRYVDYLHPHSCQRHIATLLLCHLRSVWTAGAFSKPPKAMSATASASAAAAELSKVRRCCLRSSCARGDGAARRTVRRLGSRGDPARQRTRQDKETHARAHAPAQARAANAKQAKQAKVRACTRACRRAAIPPHPCARTCPIRARGPPPAKRTMQLAPLTRPANPALPPSPEAQSLPARRCHVKWAGGEGGRGGVRAWLALPGGIEASSGRRHLFGRG